MEYIIDIFDLDQNIIFEIKDVDGLALEHMLQLILSAWIWRNTRSHINQNINRN
jgi:hypothetical protein